MWCLGQSTLGRVLSTLRAGSSTSRNGFSTGRGGVVDRVSTGLDVNGRAVWGCWRARRRGRVRRGGAAARRCGPADRRPAVRRQNVMVRVARRSRPSSAAREERAECLPGRRRCLQRHMGIRLARRRADVIAYRSAALRYGENMWLIRARPARWVIAERLAEGPVPHGCVNAEHVDDQGAPHTVGSSRSGWLGHRVDGIRGR
jgi:hypothetical protein